MRGLAFREREAGAPFDGAPPAEPARFDVALFAGLVARRRTASGAPTPVPASVAGFLVAEGHLRDASAGESELLDVPVPIDRWDTFRHLFAWDERPLATNDPRHVTTYLGAAVRAFFAHGGQRCYVVRVGSPLPYRDRDPARRHAALDAIVPGFVGRASYPRERATWRGLGLAYALEDATFLLAPDVPDLLGDLPAVEPGAAATPTLPEGFAECSTAYPASAAPRAVVLAPEPRALADARWKDWARTVARTAEIARARRDAHVLFAVPLGALGSRDERFPLERIESEGVAVDPSSNGVASAFVQLAWPWVRTTESDELPGGIEPPDGALAGALASTVLARGAFRSAARTAFPRALALVPELGAAELDRPLPWSAVDRPTVDRLCVWGRTPRGIELLSDVTTSLDPSFRSAPRSRTMSIILRTARAIATSIVFEASDPSTWSAVRRRMEATLRALWQEGALLGASEREAYTVRCDQSTTAPADLDAGRVVCEVGVTLSSPIERIAIALTLGAGSIVTAAGRLS